MDSKAERKKALLLSVFGSVILTGIVFFTAWLTTYLFITSAPAPTDTAASEIIEDLQNTTQADNDLDQGSGDIILERAEESRTAPYQLRISSYVVKSSAEIDAVDQINQRINDFVSSEIAAFENDLEFFLGDINSAESYLEIVAIDISENPEGIAINYEITSFIAGDSGPSTRTTTLNL